MSGNRLGKGWRQQLVLEALRREGPTEEIQRFAARACRDPRPYLPLSVTQCITRGLLDAGLIERFGPNGYRAVEARS